MITIVTGMGRSGSKWLAEFLEVPHENCPFAMQTHNSYWNGNVGLSKELIEYYLNKPEDYMEVDTRLRLSIIELIEAGYLVVGLVKNPRTLLPSLYNCEMHNRITAPANNVLNGFDWYNSSDVERLLFRIGEIFNLIVAQAPVIINFEMFIYNCRYARAMTKLLGKDFNRHRWAEYKDKKINSTESINKKFKWTEENEEYYKDFCDKYSNSLTKLGYK